MDAASYAAQKQQLQAEQFQRLMQMFMAARQNQQDQGWQREQFAYKQQQDAADNARQAAYVKSQEDYNKGILANQERTATRLEAKAAQDEIDSKKKASMDTYLKMFPQGKDEKWDEGEAGYIKKKEIDLRYDKPDKPNQPSSWDQRMKTIDDAGKVLELKPKEIAKMKMDYALAVRANGGDEDGAILAAMGVTAQPTAEKIAAPPGAKDGDRVRSKKTGKEGVVKSGYIEFR